MEHTFTVSRADYLALRKQMVVQLRKRRPGAPWLFLLFMTGWLFAGAAVSSFLRVHGRSGSLQDALSLVAALIAAVAMHYRRVG